MEDHLGCMLVGGLERGPHRRQGDQLEDSGGVDLDGGILKGRRTKLAERLNVCLRGLRMTLKGLA